jgi:hypothetical protein
VDSGYGLHRGFLTPYRRERYHLQEWQDGGLPINKSEGFNRRHSSLRSVVEQSFGMLKNHFPILRKMPPYPIRYQRLFMIACCSIHNFIRKHSGVEDPLFNEALQGLNPWVDVTLLQPRAVTRMSLMGYGQINRTAVRHIWEKFEM